MENKNTFYEIWYSSGQIKLEIKFLLFIVWDYTNLIFPRCIGTGRARTQYYSILF